MREFWKGREGHLTHCGAWEKRGNGKLQRKKKNQKNALSMEVTGESLVSTHITRTTREKFGKNSDGPPGETEQGPVQAEKFRKVTPTIKKGGGREGPKWPVGRGQGAKEELPGPENRTRKENKVHWGPQNIRGASCTWERNKNPGKKKHAGLSGEKRGAKTEQTMRNWEKGGARSKSDGSDGCGKPKNVICKSQKKKKNNNRKPVVPS